MTGSDLEVLAKERIIDAEALYKGKRYSGAMYLCGYAVECALKARICKHLGWTSYKIESKVVQLKTHNFDDLLGFTGFENRKKRFAKDWNEVIRWKPEMRYDTTVPTSVQTRKMIVSSQAILKILI